MSRIEKLGFIGLGVMGGRMCRNLMAKSGRPVIGYDIDASKISILAEQGPIPASSVAEVVAQADMLFICVPGEPQVREIAFSENGLVSGARSGQTVIDMTTATVDVNRQLDSWRPACGKTEPKPFTVIASK